MAEAVPVQEGLFKTDPSPRLLGSMCGACGKHQFPRNVTCPYCGRDELDDVELSDTGTLWGWTTVTAPPPGYRGEVPYGFGVVELPEGLRVITRLTEADPGRLQFGQGVRLQIVPLHTDDEGRSVVTWAFGP
jgi:uncharacterized OB-fold protein